jgi:hypothetical protein
MSKSILPYMRQVFYVCNIVGEHARLLRLPAEQWIILTIVRVHQLDATLDDDLCIKQASPSEYWRLIPLLIVSLPQRGPTKPFWRCLAAQQQWLWNATIAWPCTESHSVLWSDNFCWCWQIPSTTCPESCQYKQLW